MNLFLIDVHISVSKSVMHRGQLIGVVGLDVSLSDLAEDIIHYDVSRDSYAFLIENSTGIAIHHPSFMRPSQTHEQLMHTDIEHVEQHDHFKIVKKKILYNYNGIDTIQLKGHSNTHLTYYWRHVQSSPYIVVIASYGDKHLQQSITSPLATDASFAYHRLDLTSTPPRLCRHLKQLATIGLCPIIIDLIFRISNKYIIS